MRNEFHPSFRGSFVSFKYCIMFDILDITKNNVIAFKAHSTIEGQDYEKLEPLLEKTEREGKSLHLYLEIGDIRRVTVKGFFKDIATYFKHVRHVEKVAVVGDKKPEKNWAKIADPFIKAEIRYFPVEERDRAREWISSNNGNI